MNRALSDYYRLPSGMVDRLHTSIVSGRVGFFRFGPKTICYGRCRSGVASDVQGCKRIDAAQDVRVRGTTVDFPFDVDEVIENLRRERYEDNLASDRERMVAQEWVRKAYYAVRSLLPVSVRRHLQRAYFSDWKSRPFPAWPVDFTVDTLHEQILLLAMAAAGVRRIPFIWFWPNGAPNCLIMTHDVETLAGRNFASELMDLDASYGIKASFQVIPEKRYEVPDSFVQEIRNRGFEFNIHDLNHDGHLYRKKEEFLQRAKKINKYVHRYDTRGFRAGAMYRILDWYEAYDFSYDMSAPTVAHLEPKRGGCCTVFPFFVGKILELPLTTSQDYSVFHILNDYSIDLWKTQIRLLQERNGLISFIAHPDYLINYRSREVYKSLLGYLQQMVTREKIWAALPGEVDRWWRARSQMRLVQNGGQWQIEGPDNERARIAYAVCENDRLVYETPGTVVQERVHP